ncbi:conserved hypothetical protein [Sporisorium reilianum SRZ2]|uniref:Uncharacterized protein n=1 Tax=Sporisorium reilianum (strain SRZ2) TaxID=999809 RepID=E6ZZQ3_SPORE|nr:conserved hypothetical protein [Sporisorium reilianum SRZ2]
MGNITSRQATNLVDAFVLRLARTIDAVLRTINRKLSTLSSYLFSRIFGYDVVLVDTTSACNELARKDSLVCAPGNVCLVRASRLQQRELDKKRRSERRKRAEAAAFGEKVRHGYTAVQSVPSSPVRESGVEGVQRVLGEVARAPPPRPEVERQTVAERERGRLWVMGNVQPAKASGSSVADKTIDQHVLQRMHDQRSSLAAESVVIKRRIQPRKSSKLAHTVASSGQIQPVVEADETAVDAAARNEKPLHAPQPRVLPPGALSLGPSPWQPAFRHPFSADHEPLAPSRPKLSLDTHLEASLLPTATHATFLASPTDLADAHTISRPASAASHTRALARRSIDAISLRSSSDASASPAIDVKTLATRAVKEEKGRKGWKDEVNKAAMQRCLLQQHPAAAAGRRFSTATLATDKALARVRTHEEEGRGARRGSSPALNVVAGMTSGRSTPVLRAESPLHSISP